MTIRTAPGIDGPIILGAHCPKCEQESMPMNDGTCGWCDTQLLDAPAHASGEGGNQSVGQVKARQGRPRKVRAIVPHKPAIGRTPIPTDDLVAALRQCAAIVGGKPGLRDYKRHIARPSHRTVWRRFGTWQAALEAAGLDDA